MSAAPSHSPRAGHRLNLRVLRFRSDPGRDEPAMLAQELLSGGRYHEAVELTTQGLESDPTDGDLLLTHGVALSYVGKLETAQLALMKAASLEQDWVEPWRHLARVLYERSKVEQALAVAQRALRLDPDDPMLLQVKRDAGLEVRARQYADSPEGEEPALLASQLLALGKPEAAFEVTRTALALEVDDEDLLLLHARAAVQLEDTEEALSVLQLAALEAPDWAAVHELRAEIHEMRGELEEAADAAAQALSVEPQNTTMMTLLARVCAS